MGKEHFHSIRTLLGAILFFSSVCATVLQNAFLDNIRFASEWVKGEWQQLNDRTSPRIGSQFLSPPSLFLPFFLWLHQVEISTRNFQKGKVGPDSRGSLPLLSPSYPALQLTCLNSGAEISEYFTLLLFFLQKEVLHSFTLNQQPRPNTYVMPNVCLQNVTQFLASLCLSIRLDTPCFSNISLYCTHIDGGISNGSSLLEVEVWRARAVVTLPTITSFRVSMILSRV